ncbi:MAG TPA: hypothetical protein VIE66_19785, partial [Methylocella sp.]
ALLDIEPLYRSRSHGNFFHKHSFCLPAKPLAVEIAFSGMDIFRLALDVSAPSPSHMALYRRS